ncbi:MAG TPA: hypothetical protein VID47_17515 [Actinomycetota bacterium]|jgi:hypothetical protein
MTPGSTIRWAAPALAVLVACGHTSQADPGTGSQPGTSPPTAAGVAGAACVTAVEFRGQEYDGIPVAIAPEYGPDLDDGLFPPCNDTGGTPGSAQRAPLAALTEVSPDQAVLVRGWDDVVMVRHGLDPMPPDVQRLVTAPACRTADAPLRLAGPWLGIIGADGRPNSTSCRRTTSTSGSGAPRPTGICVRS